MKKILITGGAGYLGHILTQKLISKGYFVIIIDPLIFGQQLYIKLFNHPNVEFIVGLAGDSYVLKNILKNVYAVIHLSGLSNDPTCELDELLTKKVNVDASIILLKMSKDAGVKRFIYASSCSVYGFTGDKVVTELSPVNPLTAYARSKVINEELINKEQSDDFTVSCLRKSTLFGASQRMRFDLVINTMTGSAMSNGNITINGGAQWRPFLHVCDAADAYIHILEADKDIINGQIYNVGDNGNNYKIIDIAKMVINIIPNTILIQKDSPDQRSYHVNFDKINKINWNTKISINEGIIEIKKMFDSGIVKNYRDINYFNIKRMITYLNI